MPTHSRKGRTPKKRGKTRNLPVSHETQSLEAMTRTELPAPGRADGEGAAGLLVRRLVCRGSAGPCNAVGTRCRRTTVIGVDGIAVGTAVGAEAGAGKVVRGPLGCTRRKGTCSRDGRQGGEEESRILHIGDIETGL